MTTPSLTTAPRPARLRTVYAASRETRVCRDCGAPLTWYRLYPSGARLAFELDPHPSGHEVAADTRDAIDVLNRPTVHLCPARRGLASRQLRRRRHAA